MEKSQLKLGFVSTFPPRHCGIGTFTIALARTLGNFFLYPDPQVVAISDQKYKYSPRVIFEIRQRRKEDYRVAARFVNESSLEVVNVQHEYGIFGGEHGAYILEFLRYLRKPVVTTLHTVLPNHPPKRKMVTQRILDYSDAVVVMTRGARDSLAKIFNVDPGKIRVIPHGAPNVRMEEHDRIKRQLGFSNRFVLSTFGFINHGKGIEYVLDALPHILKDYPEALYLIIGETHPVVRELEGEVYRDTLRQKVRDLGLSHHVKFVNRYLGIEELVDYLRATDVYVTPQINPHQASSGTLTYAMVTGCAIVSTPTNYANEILANGRGVLVDFLDSVAISRAVKSFIRSPERWERVRRRAYLYGRRMIWPAVGMEYVKLFEQLVHGRPPKTFPRRELERVPQPALV